MLGCSRGKELCPAWSQGSAGGAERALREPESCPQGSRGLLPPPNLRETEAAPPPRAAGGSAGGSAPEEGGAAGTAGSGASRGSGSGTESGGASWGGQRGSCSVLPGPAALPRQADRRPDRQTGPGAAL